MLEDSLTNDLVQPRRNAYIKSGSFAKWLKSEKMMLFALLAFMMISWVPRIKGPLDLRWDGGVYYILGTSLAEGKGYKLLNEPGEISAVQYPPLFPLIIAGYQLILRTNDPTIVGGWLRITFFLVSLVYISAVFRLCKMYLSPPYAFLAALLCPFTFHVYFLSDLCFPELLFSLTTILFFINNGKESSRSSLMASYILAVAAFALRTIGLALLIAWVLESLIKKQFKQALLRCVLVLIPVLCWQFYIASVESGYGYNHPQYSYQRESYMFYNVTYARNVSLQNPFMPENGKAHVLGRIRDNVLKIPYKIGESLLGTPFWADELSETFHPPKDATAILARIENASRDIAGLIVLTGLLVMFYKRQFIISVYVLVYLSAMCMVPFTEQFTRYLMPVIPFLSVSFVLFWLTVKNVATRDNSSKKSKIYTYIFVAPILIVLLLQIVQFKIIISTEHQQLVYEDKQHNVVKYKVFYADTFTAFNSCVQYIRQHARPNDIVAAGTPHWIYLQTGLKAVMPPYEINYARAQQQLESVPVKYLIIGKDVIASERYTLPVVQHFAQLWKMVYSTPGKDWAVYQRVDHE